MCVVFSSSIFFIFALSKFYSLYLNALLDWATHIHGLLGIKKIRENVCIEPIDLLLCFGSKLNATGCASFSPFACFVLARN